MNIGDRFGRLVIVSEAPRMYRKIAYRCACDCGGEKTLPASALRSGNTKSCGCLHREMSTSLCLSRTRHGMTRRGGKVPAEYNTWSLMKDRCNNPNNKRWSSYGGRGIAVCERWSTSFAAFLADMGPKPTSQHTIDRIDVNGNYEPGNCRWATADEQAQNRRKHRSRLTPDIVIAMRAGSMSIRDAMAITGCVWTTAYSAKRGVTWQNIR